MQQWVKEKLRIIDELYPAERIERSKERWRRIWRHEEPLDRYPFVFSPITFNYCDDVFNIEDGLKAYLNEFIIRGKVNDDFIPAFFPGCRQGTIPNMFGSKEIIIGKDHSCEKIIHDYIDIDKLPEPSIGSGTIAGDWLEMQKYYLEQTEGKVPIHVTDMQGPLDACAQLWGYDSVFIAAYEEPEYYHKLMTKVTDAFILFWKEQKDLLGRNFVGTHLFGWDWVPEDAGASLSADSMVMMSPNFFEMYYKQYIEEIGNAFDGLAVHSCGNFSAIVKNLCAIPCVKAINAAQMTVEQLINAGIDTNKVIINNETVDNVENAFNILRAKKLNADITVNGLWPSVNGKVTNPDIWTEYDWNNIKRIEKEIIEKASKT